MALVGRVKWLRKAVPVPNGDFGPNWPFRCRLAGRFCLAQSQFAYSLCTEAAVPVSSPGVPKCGLGTLSSCGPGRES